MNAGSNNEFVLVNNLHSVMTFFCFASLIDIVSYCILIECVGEYFPYVSSTIKIYILSFHGKYYIHCVCNNTRWVLVRREILAQDQYSTDSKTELNYLISNCVSEEE